MEGENRALLTGIVCYWVGLILALLLKPRDSEIHLAIIVIAGLLVPIIVTYLSGKK